MRLRARLRSWLRSTLHRSRLERELENELRFHIEQYKEDLVRQGVPIAEASRRAHLEIGAVEAHKEECREALGLRLLDELRADLRYAFRTLRKSPAVTTVAIASLALGIGANTAIFSLVDAIELRSLPVNHPESLVVLASFAKDGRIGDFGYADYLAVRDGRRAFSGVLAASSQERINVAIGADSEVAVRKIVSGNYFSVLGVQPLLGGGFNNDDENLQVAVISHSFWKRSFGGSTTVVGRHIDLDGVPFTIAGVAPPEFLGETVGEAPDIWATISLMPASRRSLPGFTWLNLMGRLKPGVPPQQASADLDLVLPQLPNSFIRHIAVESGDRGSSGLRDSFAAPLGVLMAIVALVLLITCVNLASLQLARAATRQREIATRLALGAGRARIGRQLMTESLLLALSGGVLGLLFAIWSERFLLTLVASVGRTITVDLTPDIRVLGFTALISVATAMLFGLAPALQAVRRDVGAGLKLSPRILEGRGRSWGFKNGLIAMQVALSLLLLVVGGLFVRTLQNLKTQELGFRAGNVLSVQLGSGPERQAPSASMIVPLLERAGALPGIQAGSFSFFSTLADDASGVSGLKFDGYPPTRENQRAHANWVGPDYFKTSGIPMLEGREFSLADSSAAPKVAVVNQTVARHYFGNRSAVGRRFEFGKEQYEIVGVAKNAKYVDLRESNVPFVYFAALQNDSEIQSLELRTKSSPLDVARAVRAAIQEADPSLKIAEITTLEKRIDRKLALEFLVTDIAGFFGGLTLLLVSVGVYGTMAYSVARRSNEVAIRIALGARAGKVLRMILRDVLLVLVVGLAIGTLAALAAGQLVASMLFGLKSTDPATIVLAATVLSAATLVAAYIPALRATRIDPAAALRLE